MRLPFRVGELPGSLPRYARADEVGIRHGPDGVAAYAVADNVQVEVNGGSHWDSDRPPACDGGSEVDAAPFDEGGNPGCLLYWSTYDDPSAGTSEAVDEMWLVVDGTPRFVRPTLRDDGGQRDYPVADLKRLLAGLVVASPERPSAWFDLRTALGG